MERVMVLTGRFQPVHMGHVKTWRCLCEDFEEHLVVCVLRNSPQLEGMLRQGRREKDYTRMAHAALAAENNPLSNWQRLRLVQLAIQGDDALRERCTVLLRDRPDTSWERSLQDLPPKRIWVIPESDTPFGQAKVQQYRGKGEAVRAVSYPTEELHATSIRKAFRGGDLSVLDAIPHSCQAYFVEQCLATFGQPAREEGA